MRRTSEIELIVEEAREPPPAGPRNPGEPRARERERRRRTYRVRDDARGPDRSGTRRLRAGSLNRNNGSARRNHALCTTLFANAESILKTTTFR